MTDPTQAPSKERDIRVEECEHGCPRGKECADCAEEAAVSIGLTWPGRTCSPACGYCGRCT